jgi:hypothetical protein
MRRRRQLADGDDDNMAAAAVRLELSVEADMTAMINVTKTLISSLTFRYQACLHFLHAL